MIDVWAETIPDAGGLTGRVVIARRMDGDPPAEVDLTIGVEEARQLWGRLGVALEQIDRAEASAGTT